jgi:hypothetical protein
MKSRAWAKSLFNELHKQGQIINAMTIVKTASNKTMQARTRSDRV